MTATADGMGLVPDLTAPIIAAEELLASQIPLRHRPELAAALWMGGSSSAIGSVIGPAELSRAVVVDCAGELSEAYRSRAALYLPCVFTDLETRPARWERIVTLVGEIAERVRSAEQAAEIERVIVVCQQGMNRSGLVTALLLRALGEDAESAIARVRLARPGALSNQTFVALIHAWPE
jgi:hypothetical protein